jgi:hypothetical protein
MTHTFGAFVGVDLVDLLPHGDGVIGALRLAHIS